MSTPSPTYAANHTRSHAHTTDISLQRYNPSLPLSTPLYTVPSSLDFTTRMAKTLVRKTGKQCYVGSSVNLSSDVGGGTVEEEMAAFRAVVEVVTAEVGKHGASENRR